MADRQIDVKPRAIFLSMADAIFSAEVRRALAERFEIEEVPSFDALPKPLRAPILVLAYSPPREISPIPENLKESLRWIPSFLVHPEGVNLDSVPIAALIQRDLLDTRNTFLATDLMGFRDLLRPIGGAGSEVSFPLADIFSAKNKDFRPVNSENSPFLSSELSITFDPSLSPEQTKATLTALANYYRACGGVGLPAEFENQEAVTEEVHA
jgi:hypothetical protein